LVRHLSRTGRRKEARDEITKATAALPREQATLALARCYELTDDIETAAQLHEQAGKDDPVALRRAAEFYVRAGRLEQAAKSLRELMDLASKPDRAPAADVAWARRALAVVLAEGGNYPQALEAIEQLASNLPSPADQLDNLRARAAVLANQPSRAQRREAIAIFENMRGRGSITLSTDDQFLVAQLHESIGNWPESRSWMLGLLTSPTGKQATYLAYYVRSLLQRDHLDEANLWLQHLEKVDPEGFGTIEMRARLLVKRNRGSEATKELENYVGKQPDLTGAAASLLEELDRTAAEKMLRAHLSRATQPETVLLLAQFLARQKRITEALDICEGAWWNCDPEKVAANSVMVLHASKSTSEQQQRVERWLTDWLSKKPDSGVFITSLAALRNLQQRFSGAEQLYHRALVLDKNNALAMNNL